MKTILTLLLTTVCLCATADTNTVEIFQRGMLKVAEAYYKLGYRKGQAGTLDYIATNHLQHVKEMLVKAMPVLAWEELVKQNPALANMEFGKDGPIGKPSQAWSSTNLTVKWQFQEVRDQNEQYERQIKAAEAFNKTNTDPRMAMIATIPMSYFSHPLTTNDIELGFRSDGTVLWRTPPEAKQ